MLSVIHIGSRPGYTPGATQHLLPSNSKFGKLKTFILGIGNSQIDFKKKVKCLKLLILLLFFLIFENTLKAQYGPSCSNSLGCDSPYDYTISNNQDISGLGNSFSNKKFYLEGNMVIGGHVSFYCCEFVTQYSSTITINENKNLSMLDCSVYCNDWIGFVGNGNNRVFVQGCYFENFDECFKLTNPSSIKFVGNFFIGPSWHALELKEVHAYQPGIFFIANNLFTNCAIGINATDCTLLNIGNDAYDNNIFQDCTFGIVSKNSSLKITKSLFYDNDYGISTSFSGGERSYITCNGVINDPDQYTFNECAHGIEVTNGVLVTRNCSFNSTIWGVTAFSNSNITLKNNKYEYGDNSDDQSFFVNSNISNTLLDHCEIIRGQGGNGITGLGPLDLRIQNESSFKGEGTNYNYLNTCRSYIINNTSDNFQNYFNSALRTDLYDNNFYGGDTSVYIYLSGRNNFCTNHFNHVDHNYNEGEYGLIFDQSCPTTQIGENDFDYWHTEAFRINNAANIGDQTHKGNCWGVHNIIDANLTNSQPKLSIFKVNSATSCFLPRDLTVPNWFFDEIQSPDYCYRYYIADTMLIGNDISMVADTFSSSELSEWDQKLTTFKKMLDNSNLLTVTVNNDFYENQLGTDVEYVVKTWKCLEEAKYNLDLDTTLAQKYDLLTNLMDTISDVNEEMVSGITSELIAQKAALATSYDNLKDDIEELESDLETYRNGKLDDASDYNDLITGSNDFTEYEQFINGLIIQKMSDLDFMLSSEDSTDVYAIASACVETYGKVVLHALTLLPLDVVNRISHQDDPCEEALILSNYQGNKGFRYISIHPNPVKENIYISGLKDEVKKAQITSLDGKVQYDGAWKQGMSISNLGNGIYILSLEYHDGEISRKKFIKCY